MTRRTLYQTIRQRLQAAGIEDAGIESGFLLEFLLGLLLVILVDTLVLR